MGIKKFLVMRVFIIVLVLIFSLQSWVKADDVRDFQIEGMSIGDSLLNFFSEKKITNSIVNWYDDLEKNRYIAIALDSENFKQYDFVDIFTNYGDESYKIATIAGVMYFGNDKEIRDINHCYKKQITIADEIKSMFKDSQKKGPVKMMFKSADPTGKSSYTDIYLTVDDNYTVVIACYDWSDDFENKEDHMYLALRSKKVSDWLN